ncbi:P-loop NTPase fold protein [uncultured Roseivirga sp.]|uniref:KAP family P-loop NTPase fold protein n=1 Tax=uncultured Roseivirga sp. TaxID=543088 RepID=UPI0030D73AF8
MRLDSDSIAKEDKLNRKEFAKQIANGLNSGFPNGSESLVFGLNGSWGSGKSTLLSFIIDEIKTSSAESNNVNYVIYEFNPWMFSGQNQLQEQFFQGLSKEVGNSKSLLKSRLKFVSDMLDKLALLKYIHSGLGQGIKDFKDLSKKLSEEDSLINIKTNINENLVKSKIRLLITIDDLDRLTPEEVLEVFQLIKLNSNFVNTVFILAYDREVIVSYLQDKFKSNAEKYIDKIVQIDYRVPSISDFKLKEQFTEALTQLGADLAIDLPISDLESFWGNHGLRLYFSTIRDIKRFINALKLRLPSIHKEVHLTDFIVIEAVRIFDYRAYEAIYRGYMKVLRYENTDSNFKVIDDKQSEAIKKIYPVLFDYNIYDKYYHSLDPSKKIRDPEFFDRYFTLLLDENDISELEMETFLKTASKRTAIIKSKYASGKLENFLKHLRSRTTNLQLSTPLDIDIIRSFISLDSGEYQFDVRLGNEMMTILDILIGVIESQNNPFLAYQHFLSELLPNRTNRYSVVQFYLLHYMLKCYDEDFEHDFKNCGSLITKKREEILLFLKEFTDSWFSHVLIRENEEWSNPLVYRCFLLRFIQLNPEKLKDRISDYFHKDTYVLLLLKSLTIFDQSQKPLRVLIKEKNEIISGEVLTIFNARIKELDWDLLSDRDKDILEFHDLKPPQE